MSQPELLKKVIEELEGLWKRLLSEAEPLS